MPFEQLHIFLIINLCIQAPDMELKAMDCVSPCCTGRILQYAQSRSGQTRSCYTAPVHIARVESRILKQNKRIAMNQVQASQLKKGLLLNNSSKNRQIWVESVKEPLVRLACLLQNCAPA
jgi:hypothetical protein